VPGVRHAGAVVLRDLRVDEPEGLQEGDVMSGKQIAAFGSWLGSVSLIISALGGWHELLNPPVSAALLGSFGAFLHALYTEKPPNA
jgi:hypothetical protein